MTNVLGALLRHKGAAAAIVATVALGCGSVSAQAQQTFLRIAGGIGGSSWEITAGKFADMISRSGTGVQAIAQPGSMGENLARLRRNEADIGITYGFVFRGVAKGEGEFAKAHDPKLRLLAALYPAYQQPLVNKDAPWKTVEEFAADPANTKIAALTPGSATYIITDAMMEAAGAGLNEVKAKGGLVLPLNYSQGLDALRTGRANMVPINGPDNHPSVVEYQDQGRLLLMDDNLIQKVTEILPGTAPTVIPKNSYPFLTEDYKTFAVYTSLVISADVPEEVVYNATKHFWENIEEFRAVAGYARSTDIKNATVGSADLPLHPGALRYYKEAGIVK
jgi:TRAP transporter TAXI family solute receptor